VAASHSTVSAAHVQEKEDGQVKRQAPVYFVSEVLSLSKKNYTELEKVLYVVLMAFITTSEGHNEKQRSYRKNWKMGYRTQ
jgi:hypothetical protein